MTGGALLGCAQTVRITLNPSKGSGEYEAIFGGFVRFGCTSVGSLPNTPSFRFQVPGLVGRLFEECTRILALPYSAYSPLSVASLCDASYSDWLMKRPCAAVAMPTGGAGGPGEAGVAGLASARRRAGEPHSRGLHSSFFGLTFAHFLWDALVGDSLSVTKRLRLS